MMIDGWIHGWMDGYMDGWIHGWMDGWMKGKPMDELMVPINKFVIYIIIPDYSSL